LKIVQIILCYIAIKILITTLVSTPTHDKAYYSVSAALNALALREGLIGVLTVWNDNFINSVLLSVDLMLQTEKLAH